jgi:hypothetical protein
MIPRKRKGDTNRRKSEMQPRGRKATSQNTHVELLHTVLHGMREQLATPGPWAVHSGLGDEQPTTIALPWRVVHAVLSVALVLKVWFRKKHNAMLVEEAVAHGAVCVDVATRRAQCGVAVFEWHICRQHHLTDASRESKTSIIRDLAVFVRGGARFSLASEGFSSTARWTVQLAWRTFGDFVSVTGPFDRLIRTWIVFDATVIAWWPCNGDWIRSRRALRMCRF